MSIVFQHLLSTRTIASVDTRTPKTTSNRCLPGGSSPRCRKTSSGWLAKGMQQYKFDSETPHLMVDCVIIRWYTEVETSWAHVTLGKKKRKRWQQDLNLRGQCPSDNWRVFANTFKSLALTTRPYQHHDAPTESTIIYGSGGYFQW